MNLCARRSQLILLAAALLFLLVLPSESGTARERSSLDLDAVDQYIERQMAADRVPGLALAITRGDEVIYLKGYGTAGNGKPMTAHTQFYIASLSKGFTALAVMQLVEEGKIGLDEPVRAYLPEFTTTDRRLSDQITVRELLNQSSGLADSGFPTYTLPQPDSLEERIESLRHAKLVSKPGTEFHYTDPNYAVLARIVEVASGKPFGEYLRDRVFSPLEMGHTTSVLTSGEAPRAAPDLAQGHVLAFGVPIPHGEMDGFLGGSGGVISSAHDMANYLVMQNSGGQFGDADVVSQKSVSLMHTPPRGIDSSYAMGWTVPTGANPRVIEQDGVLSAFRADAALLPDEGYGVVLLYDQSYALADYAGTRQGLLDLLVSKRPDNGGLGAGKVGVILAAFALVTTALQVSGLLRLRGWAARVGGRQFWRLVPGIVWKFVPAALLVGLQPLVAFFAGRVFSYPQLFWAMPDVVSWLILGAVLGGVAGAARVMIVARRSLSAKTLKEAKVYRKSGIKRFMKAGWFRKATTEAAGPDATRRGIAAERWEELQEFRATHPLKRITVEEVSWDYIASGEGDEALLLLPGGAMVGESHFTRIPAFENRYRVIAPSYASVSTAAELLDRLAGVLDAEGVLMAHVLGPSYGGLVAQCFVRRHPGRVKTLILANTLVPPRSLLWPSKIFLTLLPFVSVGWLRTFRERTLARSFSGVPSVPQEDQAFWRDYQHGLISRLSKAELRDMYRLGIDLMQNFRFEPGDLASWPGRVLILESDEDILTPERRAELRRCYPQARVHTFHGAGHAPWMSHREEYLSVIKEFLDQ